MQQEEAAFSIIAMRSLFIIVLLSLVPPTVTGGSIYDDRPYNTLQFTPNVTHRHDLCDRQRLFRSGDIDFLDVLKGLTLSVGLPYAVGDGYINYDEEAGTFAKEPGYWIDLLDTLAERAGFSWRDSWGIVLPGYVEGANKLKPNATSDDLLQWTTAAYDFTFSEWDATIQRVKLGIDFPYGFADGSTILIAKNTHEEETSFNVFSFLQPFDLRVWSSIVATIVFTGFMYKLISSAYYTGRGAAVQPDDEDASEHVAGTNVFYAALTATGHMEFSPVTHGERILVFSLCFWALVISATYTANLASVMISKHRPIYPATSIAEAKSRGVSVCVTRSFSVATKLKRAYPNLKLVESDGLATKYEELFDNKCGLVAESASVFDVVKLNATLNPDCSLEWVGRAVDISPAGPANIVDAGFFCTSLVGHVFEYYLKDMQRDGTMESAFERYVNSVTTHRCPVKEESSSDNEKSTKLTMVDMGGIFLCHAVLCVVGLMVSGIQRFWSARQRRRGTHRQDDNIEIGTQKEIAEERFSGDNVISARQIGSGNY